MTPKVLVIALLTPLAIATVGAAQSESARVADGEPASAIFASDSAAAACRDSDAWRDDGSVRHGGVNHGGVNHGGVNHDGINHDGIGHGGIKHGRVDAHAPAFLMGDHVHKIGAWMIEYKYSNMYMEGNRAGTNRLSNQQALDFIGTVPPGTPGVSAFGATPTSMTMEMHMLHVMRGMTDDVTAYIMPMWMNNTMDHQRRNGTTFTTSNSGFADLHFGALWRVYNGCTDELILNLGLSAPTGDIDNLTSIPTGSPAEFPYAMRLGHGTWDARPAVTYRSYWERASFGLQAAFVLPMGTNDSDYRVGNEYRADAWISYLLDCDKRWAATFRVEGLWRSNYVGADPQLNANLISTADPDMRGGDYFNLGYGVMQVLPGGGRLNFEITNPISQNLRGAQLETDWAFAASFSKAF